jgi:hypothetical protein
MQTQEISKNIEQSLGQLNPYQQMKLLEFIESMTSDKKKGKRNLLKFAGAIEQSELQLMKDAIAEGCEKIDDNEW